MYVFILHEQGEDQDMNLVGSVGHLEGGGAFGADAKGGRRMGKGGVNENRGEQRWYWEKYTCI